MLQEVPTDEPYMHGDVTRVCFSHAGSVGMHNGGVGASMQRTVCLVDMKEFT